MHAIMLAVLFTFPGALTMTAVADEPKKDEAPVEAGELQKAFSTNIIAAEKTYTGKLIRVGGVAGPVQKNGKGDYFTTVGGITCFLSSDGKKMAEDLRPGRKVVVTGRLDAASTGMTVTLTMTGCGLEILPEEKKEAAKADPKAPEPLEKPYTEYVTVKLYHDQIGTADGGKKSGFFKEKANVHAYRIVEKDAPLNFMVRGAFKSGAGGNVGVKSEITDKDGTVFVVTKSKVVDGGYLVEVQKKP